jgi:hypothetical protein
LVDDEPAGGADQSDGAVVARPVEVAKSLAVRIGLSLTKDWQGKDKIVALSRAPSCVME